ncbi:MAG: glycosyltransferase family 2 protein [Clostridiales bacterium]|nr:glycosyltransferase family 2 protein [Clostridiales bacterium]
MGNSTVVTVVVTYNRKELLVECIKRLLGQENSRTDILIVDNASTDGTKDHIKSFIDNNEIIYINTGKNLGGAGGFSYGVAKAVELGYEYVWLMDDDTFAGPTALQGLMAAKDRLNDEFGYLSSIVYWKDGSLCNMNKQRYSIRKKVDAVPADMEQIIMASFVSFFVKTSTVKKVGLPIKEFFIWADDLEYSRRISLTMPCYVVPDSTVEHYMDSNNKVGIESEPESRLWRYQYLYRNEVYLYRREGFTGMLYLFARFALHNIRILFKAKDGRMKKLRVIWKSFTSGFSFKPAIEFEGTDG